MYAQLNDIFADLRLQADPSTFVVDDQLDPATPYWLLSPVSEKDNVVQTPWPADRDRKGGHTVLVCFVLNCNHCHRY
jgi:hypothetical protein